MFFFLILRSVLLSEIFTYAAVLKKIDYFE